MKTNNDKYFMTQHSILKGLMLSVIPLLVICSCNNSNIIGKVDYKFQGCFGGGHSQLTLYKTDGQSAAKLEDEDGKIKIVKLSSAQLDTFKTFITDLRNMKKSGGCTTTSYYTVFTNNEYFERTDGGCRFKGFEKLKAFLFEKADISNQTQ